MHLHPTAGSRGDGPRAAPHGRLRGAGPRTAPHGRLPASFCAPPRRTPGERPNCTTTTKHRSPRIVHKTPAQNESGGSESIESNTQLTLSEKPIEFQVDLHSARLASSLRRLTGAEAEAAPTRNGPPKPVPPRATCGATPANPTAVSSLRAHRAGEGGGGGGDERRRAGDKYAGDGGEGNGRRSVRRRRQGRPSRSLVAFGCPTDGPD